MSETSPRVRRAPPPSVAASQLALRQWIAAAPSLLAIAGVALCSVLLLGQSSGKTQARYQTAAAAAIAAGDFATARICYERLLQVEPASPPLLLGLARSLAGLDHQRDADQILRRLAPLDADGYAPAQVMLAQRLLFGPHDANSLKLAERRLRHALAADPSNSDAQSLLASLYANTGRAPSPQNP